MFNLRPPQQEIYNFTSGKMGVSAVPGSGKTHTLSALAAHLILENRLEDDQEILIVTLVNSAVENFSARIEKFLAPYHLVPGFGYRVRTLHGLAHDIVRERPDLVGLSTQFQIVDERDSETILRDSAAAWLRAYPEFSASYLKPDLDPSTLRNVVTSKWPELIMDLAGSTISQAKDLQASPHIIRQKLAQLNQSPSLLEFGLEIYEDYQRALNYRSAVDFNDLIRLALQALKTDADYLARLQRRWPYILEDEAQDSSRLQEQILTLLVGVDGNWVRVGDPNQAIYETFTTANPRFLIDFRERPDVQKKDLPHSGRSTLSILRLANFLNWWTQNEHPDPICRSALNEPYIEPTPLDDPQPNPPDNSNAIFISQNAWSPEEEVRQVVNSIRRWLPEHPDSTLAVLAPRNQRGAEVVAECQRNQIEPVELLRSSNSTRRTASILAAALAHLVDPQHPAKLRELFQKVYANNEHDQTEAENIRQIARLLNSNNNPEDYLWPRPDHNWLAQLSADPSSAAWQDQLVEFRDFIHQWQAAVILPIDQLILTISQNLFSHPADLALAHKLALALEHDSRQNPDWDLAQFSSELTRIAQNQRKFIGLSAEDTAFDPDQYKGRVVVTTIHKAKGLEWDRVYILSVNNYDFPSADNYDSWMSEKYFVRDHLNLEAETTSLLKALLADDLVGLNMAEGEASLQSRAEVAAERLRLLYVGITRAKKELIISWNTGRNGACRPATPLKALSEYLERNKNAPT